MTIAIDIGGTKTEIGLFDGGSAKEPKLLSHSSFPTSQDYHQTLQELVTQIPFSFNVQRISISFAGDVSGTGQILHAVNLPQFVGKPIKTDLKKHFKVPIDLIHDSVASATAELALGDVKRYKRIVILILGTGIGGALIDQKHEEPEIMAIEPGGLIVELKNGRSHPFNKTNGLLESYVGGGSVEAFYGASLHDAPDHDAVWDEITDYLAAGINNINSLLKPEVIVIGGGIGVKRARALLPVVEKAKQYNEFLKVPSILFSKITGNSSLLGAALYAL